jgi:hypothetical protein
VVPPSPGKNIRLDLSREATHIAHAALKDRDFLVYPQNLSSFSLLTGEGGSHCELETALIPKDLAQDP